MDGTTDDVIDLDLLTEEISKYNEASSDSIENEAAAMALTYDRAADEEYPAKTITLLDKYLQSVSKSGNPLLPWPKINKFIRNKIDVILTSFYMKYGVEDIDSVNVMPFNYSTTKEKLFEHFETFTGAPFTIQRLCEIIIDPRRHYKKTDKLFRALEKNILVVSTVGRLSSDCSEPHQRSSMFNEMQVTYTPFRGSMEFEDISSEDEDIFSSPEEYEVECKTITGLKRPASPPQGPKTPPYATSPLRELLSPGNKDTSPRTKLKARRRLILNSKPEQCFSPSLANFKPKASFKPFLNIPLRPDVSSRKSSVGTTTQKTGGIKRARYEAVASKREKPTLKVGMSGRKLQTIIERNEGEVSKCVPERKLGQKASVGTNGKAALRMEEEMKDEQMNGEPMEEDGDFSDEINRESLDSEKESEDVDMSDVHLQRVTPDDKSPDSSPVVLAASSDTSPGTSTDSKAPDSAPPVSTGSPDSSAGLSDSNGSLLKRKSESDNEEDVDESSEDGTERRKRPRLDKEAEAKELVEEHKVLESSSASKDAIVEEKQDAPCDEKEESVEMPDESTSESNDVDSMEHTSSEVSNSENKVEDPDESVQSEAPVDSSDKVKEESKESVEASPSGDLNGDAKSSEAESTDEVKAPTEEEPSSEKDTEGSAVEKEVQKSKEEADVASSSGGTDCSDSKEPDSSDAS